MIDLILDRLKVLNNAGISSTFTLTLTNEGLTYELGIGEDSHLHLTLATCELKTLKAVLTLMEEEASKNIEDGQLGLEF